MYKILLMIVGVVLVCYPAFGGESMKRGPSTGAVRHGDLEVQGSLDVAGDGGGARIQMDVNTTAPTYDTGEAGIDITELATDPVSLIYFQDDDGHRINLGEETFRLQVVDTGIADSIRCYNPMLGASNADQHCASGIAYSNVPTNWTYVFKEATVIMGITSVNQVEECSVFFSYGPDAADKAASKACTTPDCATSDQIGIALVGVDDPGNAGTASWIVTAGDQLVTDLGDVTVAGYWRVAFDRRWMCDAGADLGKMCAYDSECDGASVCTEEAQVCSSANVEVHLRANKYYTAP